MKKARADAGSIIHLPRGTHRQRRVFNVSKQRLPPEAPISKKSAVRQPAVSQRSLLPRGFDGRGHWKPNCLIVQSLQSSCLVFRGLSVDAYNVLLSLPTAILDNS